MKNPTSAPQSADPALDDGAALAAQNRKASASTLEELPSAADTQPEEDLIAHLEEWVKSAEKRFEKELTGMATSTAQAIQHVRDAITHLVDHVLAKNPAIAKAETPKEGN